MKRIVVIISLAVAFSLLTISCATQHKCPAYGHYTEVAPMEVENIA